MSFPVDREPLLISVLVATRNRQRSLEQCLRSVLTQDYPNFEALVLDDGSDEAARTREVIERLRDRRIRLICSETQMGCGGSRNRLMAEARGDIFVGLDDDAEFASPDCLRRTARHFEDPQVGATALNVTILDGIRQRPQVPFAARVLRRRPYLRDRVAPCSYFIGAGHAVRREAVARSAGYQAEWRQYLEDVDLAYRIISAGYSIVFAADVPVNHYELASVMEGGTRRDGRELYCCARNRIWFAYEHLPGRYFASHAVSWLLYYGWMAGATGYLKEYARALRDAFGALSTRKRRPLAGDALRYVQQNYGRLWY